jgi:phage shock protein A
MTDLATRITDYLLGGGLFNPELANHDAVRDLLIDCRARIEELEKALKEALSEKARWEHLATQAWEQADKANNELFKLRYADLSAPAARAVSDPKS